MLDDALRAADANKIEKLYQAALCMPVRVRVAPSQVQCVLDSLSYSEELFVAKEATSDSFFDFTVKVVRLFPGEPAIGSMTTKDLKTKLDKLGVTFHGSTPNENVIRSLLNSAPYVSDDAVAKAFKAFENVSSVLNDQTKLSAMLHATTKAFNVNATKGVSDAAVGAFCEAITAVRFGLLFKDITKEADIKKEFLIGGRAKAGFVQLLFKRKAFTDFISAMVIASSGAHAEEARDKIFPKMDSCRKFLTAFLPALSEASTSLNSIEAAVGAEDNDEDVSSGAIGSQGMAHAAASKFGTFRSDLTTCGKNLADLLNKTHTGGFNAEFLLIADAEAKAAGFTFAWVDLFTTAEGKPIGGLKLPLLSAACAKWMTSTVQQSGTESTSSAIGDADRTLTAAVQGGGGGDLDYNQMQAKTIARLDEHLAKLVNLIAMPENDYSGSNLTRAWTTTTAPPGLKTDTSDKSGKSAVGDTRLLLACAEQFPAHSSSHGPESFRGVPLQCSPEFTELVEWLTKAKHTADVVVIADGRSEIVRNSIRKTSQSAYGDDFLELWVVFDMETLLNTDVRNPKRKLAWSGANVETIFAMPPASGKGGRKTRKIVARDAYTKSGESTNFSRSYTGVPLRNLSEIPRITGNTKINILGPSAVGDFVKGRVQKEIAEKGHPLYWGEWKPVYLYSTFFADWGATEVRDFTPGSGAACIAALYLGIPYTGYCKNDAHKDWLMGFFKRMFLALVADKTVEAEAELVKNVSTYLQRSVDAARQFLPQKTSDFGDSFTADDDSADDE